MNKIDIIYYNQNLTGTLNTNATPLVGRSIEAIRYGNGWGTAETITLDGIITGSCNQDYSDIITKQNTLKSFFSKDFQIFEIKEDDNTIYYASGVKVRSISFPESTYVGAVPYSVTLQYYPQEFFSSWGVLDPSNEVSYTEQEDGIVNITHTVSARGFNTSNTTNNALTNARNFVNLYTGTINVEPLFITGINEDYYCLKEISESIDRFNGTYAITERYETTKSNTISGGLLRYTIDCNSGLEEGVTTASINGTLDGCYGGGITGLRTTYSGLNLYNLANTAYQNMFGSGNSLSTGFTSSGVGEQPNVPSISFNVVFTDDLSPTEWFEYKTSYSEDILTDIGTFNLDGTFKGRGPISGKFDRVSGLYASTNIWSIAVSSYSGYGSSYSLNPNPNSSGISINKYACEIGVQINYNNEPLPPAHFSSFKYDINVVPSLKLYAAQPLLQKGTDDAEQDKGYYVTDLNCKKRSVLTIKADGVVSRTGDTDLAITTIKGIVNGLHSGYMGTNKYLDSYTLTTGKRGRDTTVSIDSSWSYDTTAAF